MNRHFLFKTFFVLLQIVMVGLTAFCLYKVHFLDSAISAKPIPESSCSSDNVDSSKRELPRNMPHMELTELLGTLTSRQPNEKPSEYRCCSSMRAGAEPDTKIFWKQPGVTETEMNFFMFHKSGDGRQGEVYISIEGKPTKQILDTVMKPLPWNVYLFGPNPHLVYDIFLTSDFDWEDYQDFGEYLEQKKWAKHLTELDSNEMGCHSQWYEVRLPAAGNKRHQPFWMAIFWDAGNRSGTVLIWIVFNKPETNDLRCNLLNEDFDNPEKRIFLMS